MNEAQKTQLIQALKREGVFLRYCTKDGYVYELIRSVRGQVRRYIIGLKNGVVNILQVDTVRGNAA